ncbi:MAG TPA: GNAT family N-acetyltransferase [Caulobacteraceae bacterium]|jgi:ribosomal protein S18 acetylase RimI-like enzyme
MRASEISAVDFEIRSCREADTADLYRICLATGESGEDASALYEDPDIIGHIYAGPYPRFSPDSCFVAEDAQGVAGYILGALDTRHFEATLEAEWWPSLRARYPDPPRASRAVWTRDEWRAWQINHPFSAPDCLAGPYPSHLHIDLLPRLQGRGVGRLMIDHWLDRIRAQGSRGAHLGVGRANARALRFYRAYGWREIEGDGSDRKRTAWFGLNL